MTAILSANKSINNLTQPKTINAVLREKAAVRPRRLYEDISKCLIDHKNLYEA